MPKGLQKIEISFGEPTLTHYGGYPPQTIPEGAQPDEGSAVAMNFHELVEIGPLGYVGEDQKSLRLAGFSG